MDHSESELIFRIHAWFTTGYQSYNRRTVTLNSFPISVPVLPFLSASNCQILHLFLLDQRWRRNILKHIVLNQIVSKNMYCAKGPYFLHIELIGKGVYTFKRICKTKNCTWSSTHLTERFQTSTQQVNLITKQARMLRIWLEI